MANEKDATLLMRLFEIANSETMLKARNYMIFEFFPEDPRDFQPLFADRDRREHNFFFQIVTSYWEMAAAFVNHGVLDGALLYATNQEHLAIWSKLSDFMPFLRERIFGPEYLRNLETLIQDQPGGEPAVRAFKERFKRISALASVQSAGDGPTDYEYARSIP